MGFLWIGSVNQYAKGLARQTQWTLKKQSGDLTGHKKLLQDHVSFTKASDLLPNTDERDDRLSAIVTKAQAGKKLSPDEWEYLKAKYPELYEKLRAIEKEQEDYEKALRRCKTRDEARRLHVSKLGEIMAAAKNGDESALIRLNRMTQAMTAFTESEKYQKLPTEGEQAAERERERKARVEALRQEAEIQKAEREAAAESEAAEDAEAESVPETEGDTEAGPEPEADRNTEDPPHVTGRSVSHAPEQTVSRHSEPVEKRAPANDAAPAMPFGQRAYLDRQSRDSYARSRRRIFDAEA